jgi:serine/threonine-protein kinase
MVSEEGSVKVLDFGLAKLYEQSASESTAEFVATQAGTVLGTVAYMSPEQAQGQPADARSDIFSFGLVLYEMLSGRRAFSGDTPHVMTAALLRDEPLALQASPSLERIAHRCLAKQPSGRFQVISEVRTALEQVSREMEAKMSAEPQPSIAVLPFVNMSGDKEQEYFSDGLAEEIINTLTRIPGLKVTARTSAFAFRGKEQDITKIAEALHVNTILEGSVRKASNRIRISAQLINATDGYHLWSERYDRDLTDVFAVQDEISQAICHQLRVRLSDDRARAKRRTQNVEAHNLYLKGCYHLRKYTSESLAKSKEYLEQAIAIDANYAPAWSGLAELYFWQGLLGFMRPISANAQCREAALRALELDDSLPEAHAMMAILHANEYDWKKAEEEFRQAMESSPESSFVWWTHSHYYSLPMGRLDEAIAEAQRALELDPLSPLLQWNIGHRYYFTRQWDKAIEQCRNTLELDPQYHWAYLLLGWSYTYTGRPEEAIRACETALQISGPSAMTLGIMGGVYAMAGRTDIAQKLLNDLRELSEKIYVPPMAFVWIYGCLGETENVLHWLEKAVDERDGMVILIPAHLTFDPLRSHPRFHALLRKMNLEA